MLIDLHIQSNISNSGKLDPEEIILRANSIGLDGLCFTEDRPIKNWDELREFGREHGVQIFAGRKLITEQGHLLFYPSEAELVCKEGLFPYNEDENTPLKYEEVVNVAKSLGGVLVAAYPYLRKVPFPMSDKIFSLVDISAVEVRNGSCPDIVNDFALEAAIHLKLPGVGGSGPLSNLDQLGKGITLFRRDVKTQDELVEELLAGNVWPVLFQDPKDPALVQAANSALNQLRSNSPSDRNSDRGKRRNYSHSGGGTSSQHSHSHKRSRRPRHSHR